MPQVKKATVILLLFMHLYSNTELCELFKTGAFVTHYLQHKQQNRQLTFLQFIDMHYLGNDAKDNDDAEDNQLPFRHCECSLHLPIAVNHNTNAYTELNHPVAIVANRFRLYNQLSLPSCYLADIWQPPRQQC